MSKPVVWLFIPFKPLHDHIQLNYDSHHLDSKFILYSSSYYYKITFLTLRKHERVLNWFETYLKRGVDSLSDAPYTVTYSNHS